MLGILGPSGSGKSMTLKSIAGLEKPHSGLIKTNECTLYDSENNIFLKPQNRNVGYVFQNYALMPHMNIIDNIKLGIKNNKRKNDINTLCSEYIERFKLNNLEKKISLAAIWWATTTCCFSKSINNKSTHSAFRRAFFST